MIAIPRTKYGLHFHDVFFSDDPLAAREQFSLAHFSQAALPLAGLEPCATKVVNLRVDEGPLFTALSSNTRYKIRRAEREGIIPRLISKPTPNDLDTFCTFYDTFATQKQRGASNRPKVRALTERDALILSFADTHDGATVAAHAYVADSQILRTRLLYSASHFRGTDDSETRNCIGRANRFLHWHEIEQFKQLGYESYDLGGIPLDESDPEKNAIARFKSEFGGHHIIEFNGYRSSLPFVRHAITFARGILS